MREIDVNEINNIREFLCAIIQVAIADVRNKTKVKSEYQQSEINENRESAYAWICGNLESKINFQEVCDALGIETDPIFDLLNKEHETLP